MQKMDGSAVGHYQEGRSAVRPYGQVGNLLGKCDYKEAYSAQGISHHLIDEGLNEDGRVFFYTKRQSLDYRRLMNKIL